MRSWEARGFLPQTAEYAFSDLLALQTLAKLKKDGVSAHRIEAAVRAIRAKLRGVEHPLKELKVVLEGRTIHVLVDGQRMEAVSGQLLLDFDQAEIRRLLEFPGAKNEEQKREGKRAESSRWFASGLELEQTGAPVDQIIEAYQKAIDLDGTCVGALVNLGTIYFHRKDWKKAENHYRRALEADGNYALGHFNLGNLYDERGEVAKAHHHYQAALRVAPDYADAHYNLALLCQKTGELMKAVRHWKAYVKIDPSSSWAAIARRELDRLREATVVSGARNRRHELVET